VNRVTEGVPESDTFGQVTRKFRNCELDLRC
jgi:hypothetical protein